MFECQGQIQVLLRSLSAADIQENILSRLAKILFRSFFGHPVTYTTLCSLKDCKELAFKPPKPFCSSQQKNMRYIRKLLQETVGGTASCMNVERDVFALIFFTVVES